MDSPEMLENYNKFIKVSNIITVLFEIEHILECNRVIKLVINLILFRKLKGNKEYLHSYI